jgi:hypothetical protein
MSHLGRLTTQAHRALMDASKHPHIANFMAAPVGVKAGVSAAFLVLVALLFACFRSRRTASPRLPTRGSAFQPLK